MEVRKRLTITLSEPMLDLIDGVAEALGRNRSDVLEAFLARAMMDWNSYPEIARSRAELEKASTFLQSKGYEVDQRNKLAIRL